MLLLRGFNYVIRDHNLSAASVASPNIGTPIGGVLVLIKGIILAVCLSYRLICSGSIFSLT